MDGRLGRARDRRGSRTTLNLPADDWQFWAATAICVGAAYFVLRPLVPRRGKRGGCCPEGDPTAAKKKRVKLTVSAGQPRD